MIRHTPCECQGPGWCVRHQCVKANRLYHLCRRNLQWFNAWEAGTGPCTPVPESFEEETANADDGAESQKNEVTAPSILRRAMNFGRAVARHAADHMQNVDDVQYNARIAMCRQCPSCDLPRMVCREPTCGCFVETKARWASESCPRSKWPSESNDKPNAGAEPASLEPSG